MAQVERATSSTGKTYLTNKPIANQEVQPVGTVSLVEDNVSINSSIDTNITASNDINIYATNDLSIDANNLVIGGNQRQSAYTEIRSSDILIQGDNTELLAINSMWVGTNYTSGNIMTLHAPIIKFITGSLFIGTKEGLTTTQTFKDGAGVTKTMTITNGIITGIS